MIVPFYLSSYISPLLLVVISLLLNSNYFSLALFLLISLSFFLLIFFSIPFLYFSTLICCYKANLNRCILVLSNVSPSGSYSPFSYVPFYIPPLLSVVIILALRIIVSSLLFLIFLSLFRSIILLLFPLPSLSSFLYFSTLGTKASLINASSLFFLMSLLRVLVLFCYSPSFLYLFLLQVIISLVLRIIVYSTRSYFSSLFFVLLFSYLWSHFRLYLIFILLHLWHSLWRLLWTIFPSLFLISLICFVILPHLVLLSSLSSFLHLTTLVSHYSFLIVSSLLFIISLIPSLVLHLLCFLPSPSSFFISPFLSVITSLPFSSSFYPNFYYYDSQFSEIELVLNWKKTMQMVHGFELFSKKLWWFCQPQCVDGWAARW